MADDVMSEVATPASGTTSDSDASDAEEVELLVTGRERRKTAGNRYQRELVQEEADKVDEEDEVALLFAGEQDEVDEEFKSDVSDEDDMSSSDDDDQGPNAGADEMDGEKELQKQAKAERAQKRKAKDALTSTAALRKRPRIDPTSPRTAPKKPSKKKDRVSWLPDLNNAGGRSSLRKQTIQHRATTIARLKQSEAQSKITKKIREERDRERALNAPKALTQADRLAEAERTERRNAKSLNRWEAMEKKRNEEQAAKLAALKNRKLEGPVISFRSAKGKYKVPKYVPPLPAFDPAVDDGPKKKGRKTKAYHEEMARIREMELQKTGTFNPIMASQTTYMPPSGSSSAIPSQPATQGIPPQWLGPPPPRPQQLPQPGLMTAPLQPASNVPSTPVATKETDIASVDGGSMTAAQAPSGSNDASFLHGIFDYANLEGEQKANAPETAVDTTESTRPAQTEEIKPHEPPQVLDQPAAPDISTAQDQAPKTETSPAPQNPASQSMISQSIPNTHIIDVAQVQVPASQPSAAPVNPFSTPAAPPLLPQAKPLIKVLPNAPTPDIHESQISSRPSTPASPEIQQEVVDTTKNLLTLHSFDSLSPSDQTHFSVFFNTKKTAKPVRHRTEFCPITLLPARYRDPSTGIGYANLYAYRTLQELKEHKFVWSGMLGCYVGREGGVIARGCVEGFLPKVGTS